MNKQPPKDAKEESNDDGQIGHSQWTKTKNPLTTRLYGVGAQNAGSIQHRMTATSPSGLVPRSIQHDTHQLKPKLGASRMNKSHSTVVLKQQSNYKSLNSSSSMAALSPTQSEGVMVNSEDALAATNDRIQSASVKPVKDGWVSTKQKLKSSTRQKEDVLRSTFTAALGLDARYLNEFHSGNFLYLHPKQGIDQTVYDLEVVEHYDVNPDDYYTMSVEGITHFKKGASEFCPLDVWEKEYLHFEQIRRISFFQTYRKWKNFSVWKRNIRTRKMMKAKALLQKKLFFLNGHLGKTLLQLKQMCHDISTWELIGFNRNKVLTLKEFEEEQRDVRNTMNIGLRRFSDDVLELVLTSCDNVVDLFLEENKIEADHKMTFMERAALRKECRGLANFLRLADYLVMDVILQLAMHSMEKTLQFISDQMQRTSKFSVSYHFDCMTSKEAAISPSHSQFKLSFERIIRDALYLIETPERLLCHEALTTYTTASAEEEGITSWSIADINLAAVLNEDPKFNNLSQQIFVALENMFVQVQLYVQSFDPYITIYKENEKQRPAFHDIFAESSIEDFESALEKYKAQDQFFQGIPEQKQVGVLQVHSKQLKELFLPNPKKCIKEIHGLLPVIVERLASKLFLQVNELTPTALSTPLTPQHFVDKTLHMEKVVHVLPGIKDEFQRVKDMIGLMESQQWSIPDSIKDYMVLLKEGTSSLESSISGFESENEDNVVRFAQMIEESIPEINKNVLAVREKLDHPIISNENSPIEKVVSYLRHQEDQLKTLEENVQTLCHYQSVLKQPLAEFDVLQEVKQDLDIKLRLWVGLDEWKKLSAQYQCTPFAEIDVTEFSKLVGNFKKLAFQASKLLPSSKAGLLLKEQVRKFEALIPMVDDLRNPSLQDRHWEGVHRILNCEIKGNDEFTFGRLIDISAMDHAEEISAIAVAAQQEAVLEQMLNKVQNRWTGTEFEVKIHKESKDVYVLGSVEEIIVNLDESVVTINTILGSRFIGPIREEVESWRKKLMIFQDTLDEWLTVQRSWMYLETIFSAPDIQRQLPEASAIFFHVDNSWKSIMRRVHENPLAIAAGTFSGLKETFQQHNAHLDQIQKSLEDYLETKRMAFPRFYFLSNDELLEILAQSKNPQAVQPHLRKCFENLVRLDFGDVPGSVDMLAMISSESERIPLGKNLKARGNVEDWMKSLENNMKQSIYKLMKAGLLDYSTKPRSQWVQEHPGQVVATVAQMTWAQGTEAALRGGRKAEGQGERAGRGALDASDAVKAMKKWHAQVIEELNDLIVLIRGQVTKIARKIIVALVTTDVHARDIVEKLHDDHVTSTDSFLWQQQLRYYWDVSVEDVVIRHSDSIVQYGYEYMGATSRLVITPLTDRCWMTLTGAYALKLGASPAGPAGTGKTESSKDLAKAMAIQCVVFNCSDQIDYKMMGKLFRGLAQAGNWICLDEFNRIDIEVLSVVAQQLLTLREGRLGQKQDINFMGVQILLKDHHVIVTMNPGYAGRTELPDNLKVCFRPVSMMVPDYALIAEIMLFAEGFSGAKILSKKMCKLYILCSEQLSQQPHYDYGLRAVKSVLVMAGALKRSHPDDGEDVILIRALRDSNMPKFLSNDLPLFHAIVSDLFPGILIPSNSSFDELRVSIERELEKAGLQKVPPFVNKVIQLFDIFNIRFGSALVGPTGAGKTTCYQTLQKTMIHLSEREPVGVDAAAGRYERVRLNVLNPKCISMGELYGEFNEMTQEWHDGLASTILRADVMDEALTEEKCWTVFDGPIDALWIENMNTVLDDNMLLCLANGERIKLKNNMRMLFEVMDLAEASPATVSRIGVVFMTPTDLGWSPYISSWIAREFSSKDLPLDAIHRLESNISRTFEPTLKLLRRHFHEPVPSVDINLIASFCRLFQSFFTSKRSIDFQAPAPEIIRLLDMIFVFSFIWSIGATIESKDRSHFDSFLRELLQQSDIQVGLPSQGEVYDYYVDVKAKEFRSWSEIVPPFAYDDKMPYFELMVQTPDTFRYSFLLDLLTQQAFPSYVTGLTGTGKTVIIQNLLRRLQEDGSFLSVTMNFSAQTSSLVTQNTMESKLEKKRKTLLGPPATKKMVIFVDDVNMPAVEKYGAQPPIELLRQFLDFQGLYDRDKLFWKDIQDTLLLVAAAPAGGGRSHCTPRFVRHFNIFCLQEAKENSLQLIFNSIMEGFLTKFSHGVKLMREKIVGSIIEVYKRITEELLPTPAKFHYTFNLRDISKVFQGILMILPTKCPDEDTMNKLWVHETSRVFHDRLNTASDQKWYTELICMLLSKNFKLGWSEEELFHSDRAAIFGDFFKPGTPERVYEPCLDMKKTLKILSDYLDEYNMSKTNQMNLVLFKDAVNHMVRLARILRQPRGNAMLIGVGGSGKQSVAKLAAFIEECKCLQIEITRGYGIHEFREDLKTFMMQAGVSGSPHVFLFTDSQIVEETFLEDINNLLNSGEVPNLFAPDEVDRIVTSMYPVLKELNIPESSRDKCLEVFTLRVRDSLRIVLCMSPVGSALRIRCRAFPSLINCCTIDWYMDWPREALRSVAQRLLVEIPLPSEELRMALVDMCSYVHVTSNEISSEFLQQHQRHVYTTPKSYLDCIGLFAQLLTTKQNELRTIKERMEIGVQKLEETNALVDGLKSELIKLQPVLEQKSKEASTLLKQVAIDKQEAAVVQARVSKDEEIVGKQADEVAAIQADAQKDLDVALPALNNAIKALDSLSKADITEVKSFSKPPDAVKTVMEAVCILLNSKTDWDTAKKHLADAAFMDRLKSYDKDSIPPATLKKLSKYIADPGMSVDVVTKVSKAATSLCMWVHAMDVYSKVAKEVGPKRATLEIMNTKLAEANATLATKQAELKKVNQQVMELERACNYTIQEKDRLSAEAKQTEGRLTRAEKLILGLASEGERWKGTVSRLAQAILCMVGDIFLAAASISYYGAFTGAFRQKIVHLWFQESQKLGIPLSELYTLEGTLGNPIQTRDWQLKGLPTDTVSTDSAILVLQGKRWPLMIDPQGQANKWVRGIEATHGLECTRMTDANLLRTLEACIRNGKPLLIEGIEETLEPALEPILQKAIFRQGGRKLIRLGDSDIDYDDRFKMYLTTKLSNPHYLPEVYIKVTIINFTVTMDGLEDQLLGDVVRIERPGIEERKNRLVESMEKDKKQLKDLEDRILRLLSESSGNILDDVDLIDTLASSKTTSKVIKERVEEAEKTGIEINSAREAYRPVATRGSIIYFVIADLAFIDPMYQYSLSFFQKLFAKCIIDCPTNDDLAVHLQELIDYQTYNIYANICRGLFEVHKMLFSSLLCCQILRQRREISTIKWNLFLRGSSGNDRARKKINQKPERISEAQWDLLNYLDSELEDTEAASSRPSMDNREGDGETGKEEGKGDLQSSSTTPHENKNAFAGITDDLFDHWDSWLEYLDNPYSSPIPSGTKVVLNDFDTLLLMKCLAEENIQQAMSNLVAKKLGPSFCASPIVSMEDIYKDLDHKTPCIFILCSGADPTSTLLRFAKERKFAERLHLISLGQGQGPHAEALVRHARVVGDWVLLQNCHLAKSWLPSLDAIVTEIALADAHDGIEAKGVKEMGGGGGGGGGEGNNNNNNNNKDNNKDNDGNDDVGGSSRDFRLFLTSFPAAYFPIQILQNGIKLTSEPPKGLRSNLLRSMATFVSPEIYEEFHGLGAFDQGGKKEHAWKKLLAGLVFFHGIVQERRKFGPLGWNIRYEFNDTDLETSIATLRKFLVEQSEIPWDALRYVTGHINYGGRVTDDWDRRCLLCILGKFYTLEILEQGYSFSDSGIYFAPRQGTYDQWGTYLKDLPLVEDPEIFGMHENASVTYEKNESMKLLDSILGLQPRDGASLGAKSTDEVALDLVTEIESQLPKDLTTEEAGLTTFSTREVLGTVVMDSLATVLSQEMDKFNKLLRRMRSSLTDLRKAIHGLIVMSYDLDTMYGAFVDGKVPPIWVSVSFASLKGLGSWFKDLLYRVHFLRSWLRDGPPKAFPLSAFFFPQGFMTGTLQNFARKHETAIDQLSFSFTVLSTDYEDIRDGPEDGVFIYGLMLEGARWDEDNLVLADARPGRMYAVMKPIHFLPTADVKKDAHSLHRYACPVYKTSVRQGVLSTTGISTNFVVAVSLPTAHASDYWVLKGTAFLLNLDN